MTYQNVSKRFTSSQFEAPLEYWSSIPVYVLDSTILSTRCPCSSICTMWWNIQNVSKRSNDLFFSCHTCSKSPPDCLCCSQDFLPIIQQTNPLFSVLEQVKFQLQVPSKTRGVRYLVTSLRKCCHSFSSRQGMSPLRPIPPALSTATIMSIRGFMLPLFSFWLRTFILYGHCQCPV